MEPFSNYETFLQRLEKKFSISDTIRLLEEMTPGKEQIGFEKIKGIICDLLDDDTQLRMKIVDSICMAQCLSLGAPRLFQLSRVGMIFILNTLQYAGLYRWGDAQNMDKDVRYLISRITVTVFTACMNIVSHNRTKLFGLEQWETVPFPKIPSKALYQGAWIEFMEFLSQQTDVMNPPPTQGTLFSLFSSLFGK